MPRRDHNLREMLRDLGRALSEAIAESPEVGRSLRKIRRQGYTLHLLLDCKRDLDDLLHEPEGAEMAAGETMDDEAAATEPVGGETMALARRREGEEPSFRIDARDLSFLRSIGIDPTRRLRRRNGSG